MTSRIAFVGAGAVGAMAGGVYVGLGAAVSVVVADWTIRLRPPVPFLPTADPLVAPASVLVVAGAAWWGRAQTARIGPVVLLGAAGAVTLLGGWAAQHRRAAISAALRSPHRAAAPVAHRLPALLGKVARFVVRAATALGRAAGAAIRYLTFALLSLPAVLVPWVFQRLLLLDPLSGRRVGGTRWVARRRAPDLRPGHPWMEDPAERPDRPFRRVRVGLVLIGLVPVTILVTSILGSRVKEQFGTVPAAFAKDRWWRQHNDDLRTVATPGVAWNPYTAQHVQDVELATITVRDGHRVTWTPPKGKGRRLRIWVYGGSTTFGFGQRDAHTVPSELARIATAAGYHVDVVNKGVPGDLHADEARRFAWDVGGEGPKPDVVVFYDGVNDVAAAAERNQYRTNGDTDTPSLVLGSFRDEYRRRRELGDRFFPPKPPSGSGVSPTTTTPYLSPKDLARRAVADYERSRLVSRSVALATGTETLWLWQPTRVSRPPVDGEPRTEQDQFLIDEYGTARDLVADDVVDLTDVLDANRDPLFYDDIHTNELGARLVAEGMFTHLRPLLDRARSKVAPR